MSLKVVFDGVILFWFSLSLILSLILLIVMLIYFHPFHSNLSILLTFNTYITLYFTSIMMLITYGYNLYVDWYSLGSMKDHWCELRAYLVNVCFCALYYSCVLQSIYRLIRVVYYQLRYLRSYSIVFTAILVKWSLAFLLISFNLFGDDYQYLPNHYRCWIAFENTRGLLIATGIIYICPLVTIFLIYAFILRYVHRNHLRQRQRTIHRDILVLKRIVIFICVIIVIGLPTVSILFIGMISGRLIPLAYHIQGLSMALGVFLATISFAGITPQIQEIFLRSTGIERPLSFTEARLSIRNGE